MMVLPPFDTHQAVKDLEQAGFTSDQAEVLTATIQSAFTDNVATKTDIAALRTDIADLKVELKTGPAERFESLYKHLWLMGLGLLSAVFLMFRFFT